MNQPSISRFLPMRHDKTTLASSRKEAPRDPTEAVEEVNALMKFKPSDVVMEYLADTRAVA